MTRPLNAEVRHQLGRMLATPRFRNADSQAAFLKLVVERALRGKKTTGDIIAETLFPEKADSDVRVTATNLRKALKNYEVGEGREDLVIIKLPDPPKEKGVRLPEGEAYTPRFFYSPHHAISNTVQLGDYHLRWTAKAIAFLSTSCWNEAA